MGVRVENLSALVREQARLIELKSAGARVIARAVSTLKRRWVPQAKRDIGAQYALPSREIGKRLSARGDSDSVTLRGLGRNQTLIKFGARQNKLGVVAQVEKGRPVQIPHAFVRVPKGAPSAGPQVMIREEALQTLPDKVQGLAVVDHSVHGYPIVLLGGPSVAEMLRDEGREDRLIEFGQQIFSSEVTRLLERFHGG